METRVSRLLGTKYPVIQGGMAWVAEYHLAAAVSNAGGLGIIGAASAPPEVVREQIREVKARTDRPFGVNVMLLNPNAPEVAKIVIEEKVPVVTTGAGSPAKFMEAWKQAGVVVIPVVASVAMAKMMERAGADAVIAEGMESGGHIGAQTTMTLVPQVADAVSVPVIAAGGIADGRGIAASFMLGAEGVQMGTRFVVAKESIVHENYKERIVKARDIDSEVTGMSTGHPIRVLRNAMSREYLKLEKEGAGFEELELIRKDGDWWGIYVALKLLLFASVALHSYGVPVFVNDVTGIVIAFCCIVAGFLAEMRMKRKYKALRVCGLVLVLLCVVKLVLVDIRYDNVLLRAAGFFVGGILCFGISLVYNLVDKWMGRRENAKN